MDYFNELLESYNKLKKRTFKLEYINEADDKAKAKPKAKAKAKPKAKKKETEEEVSPPPSDLAFEDGASLADTAIANAPEGAAVPVMGVNGKPTEMSIYKNPQGDVVVVNLYGGEKSGKGTVQMGGGPKLTAAGEVSPAAQAKYDKDVQKAVGRKQDFIEKLSGDGEGGSDESSEEAALQAFQAEQQAIADFEAKAAAEIGGAWRLNRVQEIKEAGWMVDGESIGVQVEGRGEKNATLNHAATLLAAQGIAQEEYDASLKTNNPAVSHTEEAEYLQQMKFVDSFCRDQINSSKDDNLKAQWDNICKNPISYIAGSTVGSLEYKLANGDSIFCLDDKGKIDTAGKCKISAGLRSEAVEANSQLLSFLSPASEEEADRCETILTKVGLHGRGSKEKLIFFGEMGEEQVVDGEPARRVPSEGVVITPNPLQKFALEKLRAECPDTDWTPDIAKGEKGDEVSPLRQVLNISFGQNDKNAIKGTLYERVPQISILLRRMREAYDDANGNTKDAEYLKIHQELTKFIKETILETDTPLLEEIMNNSLEKGGSVDMQSYMDAEQAAEMYGIATSREKLKIWILSEAKAMDQWLGSIEGVVGTVHLGLQPRTGARADNALLFKYPNQAAVAAKDSRSSVQPTTYDDIIKNATPKSQIAIRKRLDNLGIVPGQAVYLMPFGQKRMDKAGNTKAGEINTEAVRDGYFRQDSTDPTPGFFTGIREVQGFGPEVDENGVEDSDFAATLQYNDELETEVSHATTGFAETTTYVGKDGKVKIATPEQHLKMASEIITGKLSWSAMMKSKFASLFFINGKKRKYSDRVVQERVQEGMEREARFRALKRDLNDPKKKDMVENYLIRNLLICGYNESEMAQIKGTNDGKVIGWSQNEPMRAIADARGAIDKDGNPRLEISIEGNTATFIVDGQKVMTWSQEGTTSGTKGTEGEQRHTRSQAKFADEYVSSPKRNFVTDTRDKNSVKEESLLFQFLAGQQRLLERLLTPTSMSQLL